MNNLGPSNQQKLFGLDKYFLMLANLYKDKVFPNKILISGQKGIGKSTLAYHFINYVLSEDENYKYDVKNFEINYESPTFKTILNKSNINLITIDINTDKKFIDINQIRNLIINLNKSAFNNKPRFVLIDNIELLNTHSINALLKIIEEPNQNVHFILINNNKKILSTLLSRCVNFKVSLTNKESLIIINQLINRKLDSLINNDLVNYYFTPGNILYLLKFAEQHKYNLLNFDLRNFLRIVIKENHYKKDPFMSYMVFQLMEFYFTKLNCSFSKKFYDQYSYFLRRISDTKTFNLDEESLFMEFEDEVLNG
jgi:DNA polymerase III subunit delta'